MIHLWGVVPRGDKGLSYRWAPGSPFHHSNGCRQSGFCNIHTKMISQFSVVVSVGLLRSLKCIICWCLLVWLQGTAWCRSSVGYVLAIAYSFLAGFKRKTDYFIGGKNTWTCCIWRNFYLKCRWLWESGSFVLSYYCVNPWWHSIS